MKQWENHQWIDCNRRWCSKSSLQTLTLSLFNNNFLSTWHGNHWKASCPFAWILKSFNSSVLNATTSRTTATPWVRLRWSRNGPGYVWVAGKVGGSRTNYPQLDALVWVQIQYHQSLMYHSRWSILTHSHHPLRFWLPPSTEKSKRTQELRLVVFCHVWLLQELFAKISPLLLQLFHSLFMLRMYDNTTCWPAGTRCNGWCGSGDQKVVIFTTRALHQELTLV